MIKETKLVTYKVNGDKKIQFPFCLIKGKQPGPIICITAGIHGCEYPGIVAAIKLFNELKPEDVTGTVKILTISNLPAFEERVMFVCPVDNVNPNRVYPGKKDGSYSEILVHYQLNEFIKGSDYYIDLHGGDMVEDLIPFSMVHKTGKQEIDQKSKKLAEFYGLPNIVTTSSDGDWTDKGTSYASASEIGIPAIIAEVGRIGQLEDGDVQMHLKGLYNVLRYIGCLKGVPQKKENLIYYKDFIWLRAKSKGIFYSKYKVGKEVKIGEELGTIEDYFGSSINKIEAPVSGRILFLTTSPSIKEKGVLLAIGVK